MGGNEENSPVMQPNSSGTDTSLSSRSKKRKARDLLKPEPPAPREVNESMVKLQFEKKLTHSDVEGQNRIIIPKAYAEIVFAETAIKDCYYFMDDMAAAKVWTFLIRSWPKGVSRMYVIEGAAEYIQEHGIKVGDYIKVYKDPEIDRFAIGWRKHDVDIDNSLADGVKKVDLPATSSEVAFVEKNALPAASPEVAFVEKNALPAISSELSFANDYHPQFAPEDETYQFINDNIDPEYVQKKFNMSWDEYIEFNPFDVPSK